MAKFYPGDRVVVRSDLHADDRCEMEDNPGNCKWYSDEHGPYSGQTVTIKELYYWNSNRCWCYKIKEDGGSGYWMDNMFEEPDVMLDHDIDEVSLMGVLMNA